MSSDVTERSLTLTTSIKRLRDEGFGTDFEVRIGDEIVKAHRLVLAASSCYFKDLLRFDSCESKQGYVEIEDLDANAVASCIDYLYSGKIEVVDVESSEAILKASFILQIHDLKIAIFTHLLHKMNPETCLLLHQYAVTFDDSTTAQSCEELMAIQLEDVAKSDQWLQLTFMQVSHCIRLVRVKDTSVLWTIMVRWVEFNRLAREVHVIEFLNIISPLDIRIVFSGIVSHLLVQNEECIQFLLTNTIEPNIDKVSMHLSVANCFDLWSWAKRFNAEKLEGHVKDFMTKYFPEVAISNRMCELHYNDLETLIKDSTNTSEEVKFQAFSNWKRDDESRKERFIHLFTQLDLAKVSTKFIQDKVRKDPDISTSLECLSRIMDALYIQSKAVKSSQAARRF